MQAVTSRTRPDSPSNLSKHREPSKPGSRPGMDLKLNINLDLELKPLKALGKRIKVFKAQQMEDLVNFVKSKDA